MLSYNLGDVRLLKIKNNDIIRNYINTFKPVNKSYKIYNMQYVEIDNININHDIYHIFQFK